MKYSEHKKLDVFNHDQWNAINECCEYIDYQLNKEGLFRKKESYDYILSMLNVDKSILEKERKQMLNEYREKLNKIES